MDKIKCDMDITGPNSETIALTKRVMDQNDAILRMNARLLDMLTTIAVVVTSKLKPTK